MSGRAGPVGLAQTFAVQQRVIGALIIREMQTRFGRHNLGFLWLFGEPMLLALAISALHSASGHRLPNGISIFVFSVMGDVPFFMFRSIVNRATGAIPSNLPLMFHRPSRSWTCRSRAPRWRRRPARASSSSSSSSSAR